MKCVVIENDSTIAAHAPRVHFLLASIQAERVCWQESQAYKNAEFESKYTFTRVLGPQASQEETYQCAAAPMLETFHNGGQNGLIFAYGITNSGSLSRLIALLNQ